MFIIDECNKVSLQKTFLTTYKNPLNSRNSDLSIREVINLNLFGDNGENNGSCIYLAFDDLNDANPGLKILEHLDMLRGRPLSKVYRKSLTNSSCIELYKTILGHDGEMFQAFQCYATIEIKKAIQLYGLDSIDFFEFVMSELAKVFNAFIRTFTNDKAEEGKIKEQVLRSSIYSYVRLIKCLNEDLPFFNMGAEVSGINSNSEFNFNFGNSIGELYITDNIYKEDEFILKGGERVLTSFSHGGNFRALIIDTGSYNKKVLIFIDKGMYYSYENFSEAFDSLMKIFPAIFKWVLKNIGHSQDDPNTIHAPYEMSLIAYRAINSRRTFVNTYIA